MSFKVNYCIYSSQNQSSRLDERNLLKPFVGLELRLRILSYGFWSYGFWGYGFWAEATDSERILGFSDSAFFTFEFKLNGFTDSRIPHFLLWKQSNSGRTPNSVADTPDCLQTRNYVNYVVLSMLARVIQDFGVCEIVVIEKGSCPQLSTVNPYMADGIYRIFAQFIRL